MADYGRDWLRHGYAARLAIVVGSRNDNGLKMFDPRMIWQITGSLFIVCGSVGGGFILSYFTPTVGLGCRSGGYMIYLVIMLGLLATDILVWWLTHDETHSSEHILGRIRNNLERYVSRGEENGEESRTKWQNRAHALILWFRSKSFRGVMKNCIIRPLEIFNTGWLIYTIFAQTFGAYQTCDCLSSDWASSGGYIDFQTYSYYRGNGIYLYWGGATALSIIVMSGGLAYIVHEYCTQSHLSTESYPRAMQGLRLTRRFKKYTAIFRVVPGFGIKLGKLLWWKISNGRSKKGRRSLIWTADTQLYRLNNLESTYTRAR
ncbi:MAG: hypothetical protein FRX48_07097 [Lasallia pustulata]|uniref:Uncharacterized protein n=1 Tax=Lasallia pustulata TaxID=136370 RepID=A0A5M8PJ08_9LECA|nr:MAG: hypothetical protein FRX48_07097 [Lasallia pustulata]